MTPQIFSGAAPIRTPHDMSPGWFGDSNRIKGMRNSDWVVAFPDGYNSFERFTIGTGFGQGFIVRVLIILFLRMTSICADLIECHLPPLGIRSRQGFLLLCCGCFSGCFFGLRSVLDFSPSLWPTSLLPHSPQPVFRSRDHGVNLLRFASHCLRFPARGFG